MKRFLTLIVISSLMLVSTAGCGSVPQSPQPQRPQKMTDAGQPPQAEATRQDVLGANKRVVMGFYTDAEGPVAGSKASMIQHLNVLDEVAFFWYTFDGNGNVKPSGKVDLSLKSLVQKHGAKAYALVDNMAGGGFDANLARRVLANPATRARFISNLVNLTTKDGWDGISIDIEKTPPAERNDFSAFVSALHTALKAKDKVLNISIPAKYVDDPKDLWSGAYDYAAIGKAADQVVLMTYDEHGMGTTQGPIAANGWVNRVITYALGKIPKDKIVMGLPVYSYDWGSNKPTQPVYQSYAQAMANAKKFGAPLLYDAHNQVPHYQYTTKGVRHEVYLENAESLNVKMQYAEKHQLHGVAIWRLGMEDPSVWNDVAKVFGTAKPGK
ncbi:Glycoside hydrolase superfamily [Acididesulfobacillus acetoxydans]|uniref:Glycoside hydrolase superfamily n=1 Tax=Acididesulfobacillus acetoxydans TaxID=1561005 RepID=A0A8S0XAI4_9FIRM|nr:glycosyl hydrolase family 18 protein [Acididesulfobacillus acetoxydans]CAA7599876.1 Glycoside hydrolase superfamily [Acididesulfobacillus acetoxydans]CEJ07442.1 Glycosyl hydrolases 18 protein [Acididesulfobacillus acetoxydans]